MLTLDAVLPITAPLLGFDLETTGTNPKTARIVEIALEIFRPGLPVKEWRSFVKPVDERGVQVPIPPGATAVHNITDDMVANAPTFAQLAPNLLRGFAGADFAGYNVRFDLRIVHQEFKRFGSSWDYEKARIIDGFRLWQVVDARSLEDAFNHWVRGKVRRVVEPTVTEAEYLEVFGDGEAHTALHDVKWSTRMIAATIAACGPELLPPDVVKLHALCWPNWYDSEGKLAWQDGELGFAFGEHRGVSLREVPRGYLSWLVKKDFPEKVKDACYRALKGEYLTAPAGVTHEEA